MSHPVTGIDHVYLLTPDLDGAAAQWQRLGFTVTPRGLHSAHMGTGNHTMMLQDDYIELLGVLTPTEANAQQRAALDASGPGLHAVACQIADAEAAVAALGELGIATGPVRHFQRPVALPGGKTGEAAFSVAVFDETAVPQGSVFMCQHRTRPTVWVPEWMAHPNGATALGAVIAVSEDPADTAARFARLYAAGAVSDIEGGKRVETGTAPILVLTQDGAAARYPGIALGDAATGVFAALEVVADMNKAAAALGDLAHAVPHGLAVAPSLATGAVVAFVEARP
jgi:hypothetical protein